jgi:hypothetical protein
MLALLLARHRHHVAILRYPDRLATLGFVEKELCCATTESDGSPLQIEFSRESGEPLELRPGISVFDHGVASLGTGAGGDGRPPARRPARRTRTLKRVASCTGALS